MTPTTAALLLGVGLAWAAAGVVLATRRPHRAPGVLALLTGLAVWGGTALSTQGDPSIGAVVLTAAALLLGPLTVAVHPGPEPTGRWHRPALAALAVAGVVGSLGAASGASVLRTGAVVVAVLVLAAHTWWRLESSSGAIRQAVTWACIGTAAAAVVLFGVAFVVPGAGTANEVAGWGAICLVPASLVVGTSPRRVLDPRLVTVTGVVLGGTVLTTMAVYVLLASLVELVAGGEPSPGVLTVVAVVAAATFHPVRVALRAVVDELLFGSRPDPLGAAAAVAEGVGDDPVVAVRTIRAALVLPYVAVVTEHGVVAASGDPQTPTRRLPIPGAGADLVVGLRPGDLALPDDDAHVLRVTVPLLALALRAHAQGEQLRESRAHTRAVLEEERRRLRRDLHDGLGPQLSGIAFTADAVDNLIGSDPDTARELVRRLRADATSAIEDIRRLVYGMRPPALDELGLVGALEQRGRGLRTPGGALLAVHVETPEPLPSLPAVVEVAAYRIATEALTNAARHSTGSVATVRLWVDEDALRVAVADSGRSDGEWTPGVGTHSMRERAQEIGGWLTAGPVGGGGRVEASLPLASAPAG